MESGVVLYLLYFVLDVSTPKSNDRPPSGPIKIITKVPKKYSLKMPKRLYQKPQIVG
jgi:hypothetical protein